MSVLLSSIQRSLSSDENRSKKDTMVTWVVAVVLLTDGEDVQKVLEQVKSLAGDVTDLEDGADTITDKVTRRYNDILMRLLINCTKA